MNEEKEDENKIINVMNSLKIFIHDMFLNEEKSSYKKKKEFLPINDIF